MLFFRHICQLTLLGLSDIKNILILTNQGVYYQKLVCEEFSDLFSLQEQGLKILLIMIKTTLRIHAKFLRPIKLIARQFW